MIRIELQDENGRCLQAAEAEEECFLCADRGYLPGDTIEISGPAHLWVRMDQSMEAGEVYLPEGKLRWPVPQGEHRLAYAPGIFEAPRHVIRARAMTAEETGRIRNLALNPADLRGDTDFFPHCTANVETRNESVFAARNVVDGLRTNTFHGEWPFESWGIGAREDAWCRLDFGREIIADRMALTLRADFPHDAWWVSGHVVSSSGRETFFRLRKTGERQWIDLGQDRVSWLRLERMVKSDDPSAFPSLRAWEVFGREARD